jgi:hypothetical protein
MATSGRRPRVLRYLVPAQVQSGLHLSSAVHAQLGPHLQPALQPQPSAMLVFMVTPFSARSVLAQARRSGQCA